MHAGDQGALRARHVCSGPGRAPLAPGRLVLHCPATAARFPSAGCTLCGGSAAPPPPPPPLRPASCTSICCTPSPTPCSSRTTLHVCVRAAAPPPSPPPPSRLPPTDTHMVLRMLCPPCPSPLSCSPPHTHTHSVRPRSPCRHHHHHHLCQVDAIGGRRFSEGTSADREIQRTLMELLSQLDGFDVVGKVRAGPGRAGPGGRTVCAWAGHVWLGSRPLQPAPRAPLLPAR